MVRRGTSRCKRGKNRNRQTQQLDAGFYHMLPHVMNHKRMVVQRHCKPDAALRLIGVAIVQLPAAVAVARLLAGLILREGGWARPAPQHSRPRLAPIQPMFDAATPQGVGS